jgi:hypothetical protein
MITWKIFFATAVTFLLAGWNSGPLQNPASQDTASRRDIDSLALLPQMETPAGRTDWLLAAPKRQAGVFRSANGREIVLDNGLIRRSFRLAPNCATVAFDNLMTGASIIRAVEPEARISVNGKTFAVGGLTGQPDHAYIVPKWIDGMTAAPGSFRFSGFEIGKPKAPFEWQRRRQAAELDWPPRGVALTFHYQAPPGELQGAAVDVHYELYDGLPILGKWITVLNDTDRTLNLDGFMSEVLAVVEAESAVDDRKEWRRPLINLISDYSFHGMDATTASQTTTWLPDPQYTSQVNYSLKSPVLLASRPPLGPDRQMAPGEAFTSFRTFAVVFDSDERERQGLTLRRTLRHLAPWGTENPIMMHVRSAESKVFRNAVDQCAQTGFEMIIYTFGSGLNMESDQPEYIDRIKADVAYAHSKGIEVGAYSLLASRRVSDEDDVINPATGKPGGAIFGNSPCLGSRWADTYFARIRNFIEKTGLDLLEHDGSYPGDLCASTQHPGHNGLADSQYTQWQTITRFYQWCRARGVYLNVPDFYFLAGSSKTGMGYRESNWSLPRDRQILLGRQNIYDGTWDKIPSMGWMFVPLVEYQGGGTAATLEPLSDHLDAYGAHLANNFGAGVQACYRGPRLYDTDATRAVVTGWVSWFKRYRAILESDIIHMRRPDGRDIDCFLHVNPGLKDRALAVVYNPLDRPVQSTLVLPLYYAGLSDAALIREKEGRSQRYRLDREYRVAVPVTVAPNGVTWFVIQSPK